MVLQPKVPLFMGAPDLPLVMALLEPLAANAGRPNCRKHLGSGSGIGGYGAPTPPPKVPPYLWQRPGSAFWVMALRNPLAANAEPMQEHLDLGSGIGGYGAPTKGAPIYGAPGLFP